MILAWQRRKYEYYWYRAVKQYNWTRSMNVQHCSIDARKPRFDIEEDVKCSMLRVSACNTCTSVNGASPSCASELVLGAISLSSGVKCSCSAYLRRTCDTLLHSPSSMEIDSIASAHHQCAHINSPPSAGVDASCATNCEIPWPPSRVRLRQTRSPTICRRRCA